ATGGRIARVLHSNDVARLDHDACQEIQRLLSALSHDYVLPGASQRSAEAEVTRYRQPQRLVAARLAVATAITQLLAQGVEQAAAPTGGGEARRVGDAASKIHGQRGAGPAHDDGFWKPAP